MLTVRSSRRRRGRENLFLSATSRRAVVRRRGGGGEIHLYSIAKNTSPRESFLAGLFLSSRVSRLRAFIYPGFKAFAVGEKLFSLFFFFRFFPVGLSFVALVRFFSSVCGKIRKKPSLCGRNYCWGKRNFSSEMRVRGAQTVSSSSDRQTTAKKTKSQKKDKKKDENPKFFLCNFHE